MLRKIGLFDAARHGSKGCLRILSAMRENRRRKRMSLSASTLAMTLLTAGTALPERQARSGARSPHTMRAQAQAGR